MLGRFTGSDLSSAFAIGGCVPVAGRAGTVIGCAGDLTGAASPRGITTPGDVDDGGPGGGVSISGGGAVGAVTSPTPTPCAGVTVSGGTDSFGSRFGWPSVAMNSRILSSVSP